MRAVILGLAAALGLAAPAGAWTRPGHMVTAAIAYDEIIRLRPDLLTALATILDAHPDRGPFQVAIDRTTGAERARRMFLECARWPDDVRLSGHDHPTWHATLWPVITPDASAETRARLARRGDTPSGEALPALALNYAVLSDPRATPTARAEALCWVLHVTGDIHQPLHTGELFSAAYPTGDAGGGRQFVRDPLGDGPISLHWLWDDSVSRSGLAADADRKGRELETAHPRAAFKTSGPFTPDRFASWAREESYPLAVSTAYGAGVPTASTEAAAPAVPAATWQEIQRQAEARVALAGYRMADVVIAAFDAAGR
ncbi:MAG: S1/P1 nuclease [Alphaproteobacteria bacterium]|nr:S1/P1 nuclease [Alphaproteobacteria bacterium]MBU1515939.1 S1/P1 nuclease [Alphaproteobacteria bacterium]MBU2096538.1 S1/P1 nuclease [Alphaproteobacteria bacterium]MBU2151690.1 S1/P1 nuclease [Alphaproteobacteria bacterium]MBU2306070.1 S1/P1 nuclease [Alphaproteobacteria bacterium]